jgi:hypothetical protein
MALTRLLNKRWWLPPFHPRTRRKSCFWVESRASPSPDERLGRADTGHPLGRRQTTQIEPFPDIRPRVWNRGTSLNQAFSRISISPYTGLQLAIFILGSASSLSFDASNEPIKRSESECEPAKSDQRFRSR